MLSYAKELWKYSQSTLNFFTSIQPLNKFSQICMKKLNVNLVSLQLFYTESQPKLILYLSWRIKLVLFKIESFWLERESFKNN